DLGPRGRAMVLDVLSVAGDQAAQAAMREALSTEAAREDAEGYVSCLQRFIFVRRPERESATFVASVIDGAQACHGLTVEGAAAVTLGALVRNLERSGEHGAASEHHARLFRDLARAAPGDERLYLLRAVGNAAGTGDEDAILAYARDGRADIRDQ